MRISGALPVIVLAVLAAPVQAAEYGRLLAEQSRLSFVSRQMGVPVDGQFGKFNLQLAFDPAKPATARAILAIDLASVDAGSREANDEVVGPNWFDVKRFPSARFESTGLKSLGGNRYELRGRMSLKGRAADLVLPITFTPVGRTGVLEGGFVLKRLEWGIGQGLWGDPGTVADEVQIKFRFVAEEIPATKPDRPASLPRPIKVDGKP